MILSILIPFIPEHNIHLEKVLMPSLKSQLVDGVEIITKGGESHKNGGLSTGAKRNDLLNQAKGRYVVFIDADDLIAENYVEEILKGCKSNKDVICFDVLYQNKTITKNVRFSMEFKRDYDTIENFYRLPNHLMAIKTGFAKKTGFRHITYGEDADFAKRLKPYLRTEYQINKTLYKYLDL